MLIAGDNFRKDHPVFVTGLWDGGVPDGDVEFNVSVTYLGIPGEGCGQYFASGENVVTDFLLTNRDIDGGADDGGDAFGHVNLTYAPRSAPATSEAGGAVELVARLSRKPLAGSTIVYSVRVSRPAAASAMPSAATFDDVNWARGVRIVITGSPEEADRDAGGDDGIGAFDDAAIGSAFDAGDDYNNDDRARYYARVDGGDDDAHGNRFNVSLALLYSDDPHFLHGSLYVAPGTSIELTNARVLPLELVAENNVDDDSSFYGMQGRRALPPLASLNVSVAPGSHAFTSESGGSLVLLVAWANPRAPPPPGYPVTFGVRTTDPAEALVAAPSTLTFDAINFEIPQRVYVVGLLDDKVDGDVSYEVRAVYFIAETTRSLFWSLIELLDHL